MPIIVKPCNLVKIREFLKLKALPNVNKPISAYENPEVAIAEVINGIDKTITEYKDQMPKVLDLTAIEQEDRFRNLVVDIGAYIGKEGNEPIAVMNPGYRFGCLSIEEYFDFLAEHKEQGIITYSIAYTFNITGIRNVNLTPRGWVMLRSFIVEISSKV